jgi:hypothetical protein
MTAVQGDIRTKYYLNSTLESFRYTKLLRGSYAEFYQSLITLHYIALRIYCMCRSDTGSVYI